MQETEKRFFFYRWINKLSHAAGIIAAFCLLIVAFSVTYEVFMRYLFNSPTTWVAEMSIYLIMASGMLAAAYVLQGDGHFSITIVTDRLNPVNKRRLRIITDIAGTAYCIIFIIKGIEMVQFAYEMEDISTGLLAAPLWIPNLLIPIGGLLLTLQFLNRLADVISGRTQL